MKNKGMLINNKKVDWQTPPDLVEKLIKIFGEFDLDPACDMPNIPAKVHYTKAEDGLKQTWNFPNVFLNPPYGHEVKDWMRKASSGEAGRVVCLVFARTDTDWWHANVDKASCIMFFKGRLKFVGEGSFTSAPCPSCLVIFGKVTVEQIRQLMEMGMVLCNMKKGM